MNKKFKLMLLGTIVPALLTNVCSAKTVDTIAIDDASGKMIISGTPDGVKKGDIITFELLKKDMKSADIKTEYTPNELIDDFIVIRQLKANDNGGYSVSANISGRKSGFYIARVNGTDEEIYFATEADRQEIIEKILNACKLEEADAIKELSAIYDLSDKRGETINSFNIVDELVFAVEEDNLFKSLRAIVGDSEEEALSAANLKEKTSAAAAVSALNENKTTIDEVKDILALDNDFYEEYTNKLSDTAKVNFVKNYFSGMGINTRTKVRERFKNVIIDALCSDVSNWADAEDIINEYGASLGINVDELNSKNYGAGNRSKVYSAAADVGSFKSASEFASFINIKITEYAPKPQGSNFKQIGGAPGGTSVTPPVVTKENKEGNDTITPAPSFDDLEGYEWAMSSIEELYRRGVVKGMGDGTFNPGGNVTREEMLAMLLRAFNIAEAKANGEIFTDADSEEWYIGYLAAAKNNGYISGYPDGRFGVGDNVSRQDAAVMAYNIAKASGTEFKNSEMSAFGDDGSIADYAKGAVYALRAQEVLSGTGGGNFEPSNTCTRAEAAKIIYKLMLVGRETDK